MTAARQYGGWLPATKITMVTAMEPALITLAAVRGQAVGWQITLIVMTVMAMLTQDNLIIFQ